jgi:hypothetical protein
MGYMENLNRLVAVSVDVLNPLQKEHPDVAVNVSVSYYSTNIGIFIYAAEGHDPVETLKAVRKAVGTVEKKQGFSGLYLTQQTNYDDGSRVEYTIYPASGTCEKVKVGTKVVEKPDPNVEVPTVEVEEDVYEWECKGVNV